MEATSLFCFVLCLHDVYCRMYLMSLRAVNRPGRLLRLASTSLGSSDVSETDLTNRKTVSSCLCSCRLCCRICRPIHTINTEHLRNALAVRVDSCAITARKQSDADCSTPFFARMMSLKQSAIIENSAGEAGFHLLVGMPVVHGAAAVHCP